MHFKFWYIQSESDSRWNCMGGILNPASLTEYAMPEEVRVKMEELKEKYGEKPRDLLWGRN